MDRVGTLNGRWSSAMRIPTREEAVLSALSTGMPTACLIAAIVSYSASHELALLRCAFEYRETLNLKAPWNNREPKGAFVLHILVYEKPSQREL